VQLTGSLKTSQSCSNRDPDKRLLPTREREREEREREKREREREKRERRDEKTPLKNPNVV